VHDDYSVHAPTQYAFFTKLRQHNAEHSGIYICGREPISY
jgi:hypothetical protein